MSARAERRIIVIGTGILGASIAYHLARSGAEVTVISGGEARATDASFGWINASFYQDADHFRLRAEGIAGYRRLCRELALPIAWQGCLCWENAGAELEMQRDALIALGYAVEEVDASRFSVLEPAVAHPPERALLFGSEAAAESADLARGLIRAAEGLGARRISGVHVTGWIDNGDRITGVTTTAGHLMADEVVLAAGTGSAALMALADAPLPMLDRPALMLRTAPVPPVLRHILVSRIGEVRQRPDGCLIMPTTIGHQGDTSDMLTESAAEAAEHAAARLRGLLPDVPIDWAEVTLAHRPVPQDGLPAVGLVRPGLYLAVMHSGLTLGAVTGDLVAREVLDGPRNATVQLLAAYRPDRFRTG